MSMEIANAILALVFVPIMLVLTWFMYRVACCLMGTFKATALKDAYWLWKFNQECKKRNVPVEELEKEIESWKWSLLKKKEQPKHVLDKIDNDITGEFEERKAKAETKK